MSDKYVKIIYGFVGGFSLCFGLILLPLVFFHISGAIVCLSFIGIGIFCFISIFIKNFRMRRFNIYVSLIGNKKSIEIKWLALKMNCDEEKAVKNLRYAISYGYFEDAYIDEGRGLVLFPNYNAAGAEKTIRCPNCGAFVDVITGYYSKCPYCGFVLDTEVSL